MDILGVSKIADSITNIVGRFIPDKNQLAEVKADLEKSISNGEIELEKIALEKDKLNANYRVELLQKLPVPFILYTFLLIIINNSIISPYINLIFNVQVPILPIDENLYNLIGWLFGSVMAKQTVGKFSPNLFKK